MFGYVSLGKVRKSTFDGKVAPLQVWLVWQNLVFAQLGLWQVWNNFDNFGQGRLDHFKHKHICKKCPSLYPFVNFAKLAFNFTNACQTRRSI
jgi:hypothetical protein